MVKIQMSKQAKKGRGIRAKGMKVLETMPAKKSVKYQFAFSLLGKEERSHEFIGGNSWPYPWVISNILPMLESISNRNTAADTSACTTIF